MTNLVLGSILMPIFIAMCNGNTELAWRTVSVVPAVLAIVTGLIICNISDDAPKGDYDELRKYGQFPNPQLTAWGSWKKGSLNHNTWMYVSPLILLRLRSLQLA
jgi:NNP family nitrate/nitrite transporter-like MFS transporter